MGTPRRYLKAYLEAREPDRLAILRFPPGVTLEDAGHDWASLFTDAPEPVLSADTLGRLSDLGVETIASGAMEDIEAGGALREMYIDADPDAYIEDYLDVNARLGGERCVSVEEYAMDTLLRATPLRDHMRERLVKAASGGVETHGDVVFRASEVPAAASLRVGHLLRGTGGATARVRCRLHMRTCGRFGIYLSSVLEMIRPEHQHRRVPAPLELLRGRQNWDGDAHVAIARLVLDTLPEEAWLATAPSDPPARDDLIRAVCLSMASTCEEYEMLRAALGRCRTAREIVQRALDPGWVVARALEAMRPDGAR